MKITVFLRQCHLYRLSSQIHRTYKTLDLPGKGAVKSKFGKCRHCRYFHEIQQFLSLACWGKHRIWNGKQSSSVQYRTVRHLVSFGYRQALCNQKLLTACQAQGGKAYDDDEVWNGEVQKADALPSMVTQTVTHLVFLGRDKLCVTKNFCHTKTCFMQIRRREPRWAPTHVVKD